MAGKRGYSKQNYQEYGYSADGERNMTRAKRGRRMSRRRKRAYLLYYIIFFLFVAITLVTLSMTVLFNIEKIDVRGIDDAETIELILQSADIEVGENLIRLNTNEVKNKVYNEVTDIDKVEVKREFPSTLSITVEKAKAEYNIKNDDDSYTLVSKNYRVMDAHREDPKENVLIITGLDIGRVEYAQLLDLDSVENYETVKQVLEAIKENNLKNIVEIDVTNTVNITLNYNNENQILLGAISAVDYKIQFAKEVIDNKLSENEIGIIDARVEGQVSFKPNDEIYAVSSAEETSSNAKNKKTESKSDESN